MARASFTRASGSSSRTYPVPDFRAPPPTAATTWTRSTSVRSPAPGERIFFSVDEGFLDPVVTLNNSGTAQFDGVQGADVLAVPFQGGNFIVYANAQTLGLNMMGPGTDDLDGLVLAENGVPGYQPSSVPYDWLPPAPGPGARPAGVGTDMLLFSVRRGSAVIGRPDSIFGIPIEEGDVLTNPLPTADGGLSPFPGIYIAAENVGLGTARSGATRGDDANGISISQDDTTEYDCNNNGREDSVDISCGFSSDVNMNGIPDCCETAVEYCFCDGLGPCGNDSATTGCANSATAGAFMTATGTTSVLSDDLVLTAVDLPPNKSGLFFMGPGMVNTAFGDGRRCVGGMTKRFLPPVNSGAGGTASIGPVVGFTLANFPPSHQIAVSSTWNFQMWYRDPMGPCGSGFNLSSAMSATFVP